MNIIVVALLAGTAVVGAVLWYVVDRHRHRITPGVAAMAAGIPVLLLGAAALLALGGSPAGTGVLRTAHAVAVAAAVPGGWLLATAVLRLADRAPHDRETPSQLPPPPARHAFSDPATLRGGTTIGALERVAVVVTLLAGWPEGLALALAVKGFGRYPELRQPSAPERFIIGTFASILWAIAVAGVVVALRT